MELLSNQSHILLERLSLSDSYAPTHLGYNPHCLPSNIMCLLDNGLVVPVEIDQNTTFSQLYNTTMTLARESPLYCASDFEDVEFSMLYFTQYGEQKYGLANETVLPSMEPSDDISALGPLLSVVKFEKKPSRWDEYSKLAPVLNCDVEDIKCLVGIQDNRDLDGMMRIKNLKELDIEVQQFRRTSEILALDSLAERVKQVRRENTKEKKLSLYLKTVCSFSKPRKVPRLDPGLHDLLSSASGARHIELVTCESGNSGSGAVNFVLQNMDYLTTKVSSVLSKILPSINQHIFLSSNPLNSHVIRNSKYIIKVFGKEIYFSEDVLLIEVPEIVEQLTQLYRERHPSSVIMKLVVCEKALIAEKYNYHKFEESCLKNSSEFEAIKKDILQRDERQQDVLAKTEKVSISSLTMDEKYYFHPSAVTLGNQVGAELSGDNFWISVTTFLTFGDTIITSTTFPIKRKKEALWVSAEEIKLGRTDVSVRSLPRSATLCFIVQISKTEKPSQYDYVKKFWANFCIFDVYGYLKCGYNDLHLWELPQDQLVIDQPYLTGTTIDNFKTFQKKETRVQLLLSCMSKLQPKYSYYFDTPISMTLNVQWLTKINRLTNVNLTHLSNIDERTPEEKVWIFKQAVEYYYQNLRHIDNIFHDQKLVHWIPQIVRCVDFSDSDMVHNLKLVLGKCQLDPESTLKTDQCLVLLGFHCQDIEVRKFAVDHLAKKSATELKSYLLQICECLKFERYLVNDLTFMLLKKAFHDHKFAHALFWNLRVFLFDEHHWLRTCLIIEALFSGIPDYQLLLEKPLKVLDKLRVINSQLKKLENSSNEKQSFILHEYMTNNSSLLSNYLCPLCPATFLSDLIIKDCKCIRSKMKPIRLVYNTESVAVDNSPSLSSCALTTILHNNNNGNNNTNGNSPLSNGGNATNHHQPPSSSFTYELMFKIGDDLRQDVLMLQLFTAFNSLWIDHDLDLKLLSYKCVAAELDAGLIEMVQNASTISKIQKWYNENVKKGSFSAVSAAWSKDAIYRWLASNIKEKNKLLPEETVRNSVHEFVLSCAGSCVASYVLGIGDRHNDNIMVHRSGRLFHIDFGHILGRKKQKFGINRERVPLILPASFMYIINKDFEESEDRQNFKFFQDLCVKAFLVLRDNVDMVCNMLYAMKNAGMPELKSLNDVNYVRETLFIGDTKDEAEKKFVQKINESIKSSWTTNVNWAIHNWAN